MSDNESRISRYEDNDRRVPKQPEDEPITPKSDDGRRVHVRRPEDEHRVNKSEDECTFNESKDSCHVPSSILYRFLDIVELAPFPSMHGIVTMNEKQPTIQQQCNICN